jgi:hypothetical protein
MLLFCAGCAQVRSLPGGVKDVSPPVAVSANPPHLTTHFQGNRIEIFFDEYVQLNNIQQELIISPPQQKFPEIRVKQHSIILQFNDPLLPNTTYQLNFGDGVVDVNENNKAENLIYVFSTGSAIDSLSIKGKVRNVEAGILADKFKVLLFENDTAAFSPKTNPLYFTRTGSDGSFNLAYLRADRYSMIALDDINGNYHWDEGEAIAMLREPIEPMSGDSTLQILQASTPLPEIPDISSYQVDSTGILRFPLDPHFTNIRVNRLNGEGLDIHQFNDSVFAVLTGKPADQFVEVEVALDSIVIDTLEIPFFAAAQNDKLKLRSQTPPKISDRVAATIFTDQPAVIKNEKLIEVRSDSTLLNFTLVKLAGDFGFNIESNIPPGQNAEIIIPPGTFESYSGAVHDSLSIKTYRYKPEELGTLVLSVDADSSMGTLLFMLTDKNNRIVYREHIKPDQTVTVRDLPPGDYSAKAIEDVNLNFLYDPIDLDKKSDPEITHLYSGKISVRSNWELKLSWRIE